MMTNPYRAAAPKGSLPAVVFGVPVALIGALAWSLLAGATIPAILTTTAVALGVGLCAGMLPHRLLMPAAIAGIIGSLALVPRDNMLALVAILAYAAGAMAIGFLRGARSSATTAGAAPRRLAWDEGKARQVIANPSRPQVQSCLSSLDGATRTMMSLHRDGARVDVCCPKPGAFLVFHTSREAGRDVERQALPRPLATQLPGSPVQFRIGGSVLHYPDGKLVDPAIARAAVERFWTDGATDPALNWVASTPDDEVLRPPPLAELD
jgi:hypothetical protein